MQIYPQRVFCADRRLLSRSWALSCLLRSPGLPHSRRSSTPPVLRLFRRAPPQRPAIHHHRRHHHRYLDNGCQCALPYWHIGESRAVTRATVSNGHGARLFEPRTDFIASTSLSWRDRAPRDSSQRLNVPRRPGAVTSLALS